MGKVQGLLDAVDLDLDGHAARLGLALGLQLDLVDSGKDLDNLGRLGSGDSRGQDGDGDESRSVLEEEVLAVVDLVAVGLVVEGADVGWLDAAGGRQHVVGNLLDDLDLC